MPLIVDKEAMRMEILMAFQRCIEKKPLTKVSLRDIAAEAGMSHAKLLNYFESRDDLVVSYVRYTKDFMTEKCKAWFLEHDRRDYESNLAYMNAFMSYVANGKAGEERPNATTQTYVLTHYNEEVSRLVKAEFKEWRETMEQCLIAVYGEHPTTSTEYIAETIETCYNRKVKAPKTGAPVGIRRVNVNAAPLPVEDLKVLKSVGIGTFQVFQETYNRKLYEEMHPSWSVKGNYDWRTTCFHRCLEAGVDDVGFGVLYGLCDWRFELLATVMHARDLERWFNIGPHTLSFPRLEPASGTRVPEESPWLIDDDTFARILVIARLSVPYTGIIVTARESPESRNRVLDHGMTQLDCSSNIAIKGYSDFANEAHQEKERQQFMLGDNRSIDEMVRYLASRGTITSFCTAGYRCGRTGGCIMDALKTGREGKFCKINAVLTFREWLDDFASDETRKMGDALIEKELAGIKEWLPKFYPTVMKQYEATCRGERDLFF